MDNENHEVGIIVDALVDAMERADMSAAKLARESGVSKPTISLILAEKRPNTPASIVAKLARALGVSVDYLVGLTSDPSPRTEQLGDLLLELTQVARRLTDRRQRDLLLMAKSYLEASKQSKENPSLLMSDLLDLIHEAGGEASRDQLMELLGGFGSGGESIGALGDDGEEPLHGDE